MTSEPLPIYRERKSAFAAQQAACRKSFDRLSNARLAVFLAALAGLLWFAFHDSALYALLVLFAGTAAFIALVVGHGKAQTGERLSARLLDINEAGIRRMEGSWTRAPGDGGEFADDKHPYASDLDVFGPASLYQWMNATQTRMGRLRLRSLLSDPPRPDASVSGSQAMVRELAPRLDWRQRFQAAGRFLPEGKEDPDGLLAWAEDPAEIFPRSGAVRVLRFLPMLTFAAALAAFLYLDTTAGFLLAAIANLSIASWNSRRHGGLMASLVRQQASLEGYLELLRHMESGGFADPGLKALLLRLQGPGGASAASSVRGLLSIADWMETRNNPILSFLVNALCLWDIQWLWAFRRWKRGNASRLRVWLETLAQMEALSSLAAIPFENPDWCFPEVAEGEPLLDARDMGHPLIPSGARVRNDLAIGGAGEVLIITGSNMSGKSTLLRTVGVNLVLAYAGAPVCALGFRCAPLEVHTSMRLRDDLENRISSFYAELLRIKTVIEAARAGRRVLFLVDEIFRGTNSKDRHEGAMTVLRRLHSLGAAGLVSTHDLELARLEEIEPGHFRNFHFQEGYAGGEIRFDFRLRPGVSTTTNAIHLIRMVGID